MLVACRWALGYRTETKILNLEVDPVDEFQAWVQVDHYGQRAMWPGELTLADCFFKTLHEYAVPID